MTRGMQAFSLISFFILGAALAWFVVANPLGMSFLPGQDGADRRPGGGGRYGVPVPDAPRGDRVRAWRLPDLRHGLVEVGRYAAAGRCRRARRDSDRSGPGPEHRRRQRRGAKRGRSRAAAERWAFSISTPSASPGSTPSSPAGSRRSTSTTSGQEVRQGEPLFEIYSPELVTTQEEYLRALDYRESLEGSDRPETRRQAESLLRSTRERLAYWDISDEQIRPPGNEPRSPAPSDRRLARRRRRRRGDERVPGGDVRQARHEPVQDRRPLRAVGPRRRLRVGHALGS